jgi:serine/threonine protein kinase
VTAGLLQLEMSLTRQQRCYGSVTEPYGVVRITCCWQRAQVLARVALRLQALHDARQVHGNVTPSNIKWMARENRWMLSDFQSTMLSGSRAPAPVSPQYAAPEVVEQAEAHNGTVEASPAMDAWSFGVIALELITGASVMDDGERVRLSPDPVRVSYPP